LNLHIVTVGSRGDIDPLIALGIGLKEAGYSVKLIANTDGREQALQSNLEFGDLQFSVADILRSAQGLAMLQSGSSHQSRSFLLDAAIAHLPVIGPRIIEQCHDADVILSTETIHLLCASIAEHRQVRHIALGFIPYGRTDVYLSFYADTNELRTLSNGASHDFIERFHHEKLLPAINALRTHHLNLPELDLETAYRQREACPAVMGYSPSVFPPPHDWPIHRDVTGYWHLSTATPRDTSTANIDPRLVEFIEAGSPPLYIGFGSMNYDPAQLKPLLEAIVSETEVRIVYGTGWIDEQRIRNLNLPDSIFVASHVSHLWLFPRMLGTLHHGGAGTTASSILSGVPTLIAWFIVDQVFWATRVAQLGVGIDLGNFHDLTTESVISAIRRLQTDQTLKQNAVLLGMKVNEEDGIQRAVRAIQRYIATH
jgi:sterol 3beta-glucosyltransferase